MNITIYTETKKIKPFISEALKEYGKRIGRYGKVSLREYKSTDKLIKSLSKIKLIVCINENGKLVSSEELADMISIAEISGRSEAVVVVGNDSLERELRKSHEDGLIESLAISRMSMSEDILMVVIYEQIYRAYKIINGEIYHK